MKYCLLIFALVAVFSGNAQERIRPGVFYHSGQELLAPRYGIVSRVPDNWIGILPQDIELFLLMPVSEQDGQIMAIAREGTMEQIIDDWENSQLEGDLGIVLKKSGPIAQRNGSLAAEFIVSGSTGMKAEKAYAEAKCGAFGNCIVLLLMCPAKYFDSFKKGLQEFNDNTIFIEPSIQNIYGDFNWKEFLSNKYLATYTSNDTFTRDNQLWLCPDGTFRSKIKNKNWGNVPDAYQGQKKGTYLVSGIGSTAELQLDFLKLDPVKLSLEIQEEKIFINGDRFYVMENGRCR